MEGLTVGLLELGEVIDISAVNSPFLPKLCLIVFGDLLAVQGA